MGFAPERGNRYLYAFAGEGPIEPNTGAPLKDAVGVGRDRALGLGASNADALAAMPADLKLELGLRGKCPSCEITMVGVGNIDNDLGLDVWSLSSADRPGIPAGTPHDDVRDLDH